MYQTDLLHSRGVVESLLKILKDSLIILNAEDQIEAVNDSGLKLFGFSSVEEIKGKHISQLFLNTDEAVNFIDFLKFNGHFEGWQNTFVRPDGRPFTGCYSAIQIQDVEGAAYSKIILLSDLTDKKNAEQKLKEYTHRLEKSNKELDQFAYIVSHDLKAPLRAISNLSLWLQEDLGASLSDDNKNNLTMLRNRVVRLETLINGILEYSKAGRAQVTTERVDVFDLINDVIEMLAPPAHISVQVDSQIPAIEAPRVLLVQVFSNLIGNAIKYNDKAQGLVKIYCMEKEKHFEFVIEDNGPGIPEEFYEKIFVIFQTLQARDKFESTGIGLTIVKRIIEECGGKIWVESTVGAGSKFSFSWPIKSSQFQTS